MQMKKNRVLFAAAAAWLAMPSAGVGQTLGKSDPSFSQPSRSPGVDYVLPTESEIKATLDRIRDHFVRSTPYHIVDTQTGAVITDLSKPAKTAGIDMRAGQFNDWDYPMGVVLAAMQATARTHSRTSISSSTTRTISGSRRSYTVRRVMGCAACWNFANWTIAALSEPP